PQHSCHRRFYPSVHGHLAYCVHRPPGGELDPLVLLDALPLYHLRVDQVRRRRRGGPCVQVDLGDRVYCLQGGRGDHHLGMEQYHHAHLPRHCHCCHQRCDPSVQAHLEYCVHRLQGGGPDHLVG